MEHMSTTYRVGKVYPEFATGEEGPSCAMTDNGLMVVVKMPGITAWEEAQFKAGTPMELRFVSVRGVFFFLLRFGDMDWMDAPFSPHLAPAFKLDDLADGQGYSCTVMLADSKTGELRSLRLIGLGTGFCLALKKELRALPAMPTLDYYYTLDAVMAAYPTAALAKLAKDRYVSQEKED